MRFGEAGLSTVQDATVSRPAARGLIAYFTPKSQSTPTRRLSQILHYLAHSYQSVFSTPAMRFHDL